MWISSNLNVHLCHFGLYLGLAAVRNVTSDSQLVANTMQPEPQLERTYGSKVNLVATYMCPRDFRNLVRAQQSFLGCTNIQPWIIVQREAEEDLCVVSPAEAGFQVEGDAFDLFTIFHGRVGVS